MIHDDTRLQLRAVEVGQRRIEDAVKTVAAFDRRVAVLERLAAGLDQRLARG